jgi:hypothetical protein
MTGEASAEDDDVALGTIPVQGSTIGDVDPEPQAPMGTHGKSQAPTHGHPPQEPSTAINNVIQPKVLLEESLLL